MNAYEITKNQKYLVTALSAGNFILKDLNRTEYKSGFLFSYSPLNGNNTVFNASLLGAKVLSQLYSYNKNELYRETAEALVKAGVEAQSEDGSWVYGMLPVQNWKDSFHTGYNLDALISYQELTGDKSFHSNIEKDFGQYDLPKEVATSRKGLGGFSTNRGHVEDLDELDITSATVNIWFSKFMFSKPAASKSAPSSCAERARPVCIAIQ